MEPKEIKKAQALIDSVRNGTDDLKPVEASFPKPPSGFVRPPKPQVRDLRERFIEILLEEFNPSPDVRDGFGIERVADLLVDEVARTTALDPE